MFHQTNFRTGTLLVLVIIAVVSILVSGYFGLEILAEILILAMLALALDIAAGFGGMVSLAHGALFGVGAYAYALISIHTGFSPLLAMGLAVLFTGGIAWIMGAIFSNNHGIFFILVTLAFGQMAQSYVFESPHFGGDDGLSGILRPDFSAIGVDLNNSQNFAAYALVTLIILYFLAARFLQSGLGRSLIGIMNNEQRMKALGLVTWRVKATAFGVSGAMAGLAGVFAAQHSLYISPDLLNWTVSGEVLVVVILGGLGTLVGPIVGAAVFVLIKHEASSFTPYWHLVTGVVLIAVVMSRANGIFGFIEERFQRVKDRRNMQAKGKSDA